MNKTANESNSIDVRDDVEMVAYSLNEPITLLNLLSDELDDIYKCISDIKQAKTKADELSKQQFLACYMVQRIETITTLRTVATDLIANKKAELLDLTKQD